MAMMRTLLAVLLACIYASLPAAAAPTSSDSSFGVLLGISPFGGSMTFSRHTSSKTTWQCAIGGNPEGKFPVDVAGQAYTLRTTSSWVGWFVNHRPVTSAPWFRVVTGFAIGNIRHRLNDGSGNIFAVDYKESPVGYVGLGTGTGTKRGFTIGFDVGWLQSAGPTVSFDRGPSTEATGALSATEKRRRTDQIADSFFFGSFMPNIQVGLGYNF